MAYFIIGLVSIIALFGGGKKTFDEFGGKRITIVILLTLVMIGNLIPPIRIVDTFYLSIGGTLLLIYAFIAVFYQNKFKNQIYVFYMSALLGIAFSFIGKYLFKLTDVFAEENYVFYLVIALITCIFSGNAKNSFSIGVLSVIICDLIFKMMSNQAIILGGGGSFNAMVIVAFVAFIGQLLFRIVTERIYPSRREMIYEASDELYPNENEKKENPPKSELTRKDKRKLKREKAKQAKTIKSAKKKEIKASKKNQINK